MLAGRTVRGLDQTGLSQKAGPVVSDLRISANGTPMSNRANSAGVDCFLAFDLLVGASDTHRTGARGTDDRDRLGGADPDRGDGRPPDDAVPRARPAHRAPRRGVAGATNRYPNAAAITSGLFGDADDGQHLPPRRGRAGRGDPRRRGADRAGDRAQRRRRRAQRRRLPLGSPVVASPTRSSRPPGSWRHPRPETLDELIDRLAADLVDYQSARYADRFRRVVAKARQAEQASTRRPRVHRRRRPQPAQADGLQGRVRGGPPAPLPESRAAYEAVGGPRTKVTWRLHPPTLRALGRKSKMKFGPPRCRCSRRLRAPSAVRHAARPVPLGRGAPHRAGDDPRVRRAVERCPASSPPPTSPRRRRSPPSPTRSAATSTSSSPRRALPRGAGRAYRRLSPDPNWRGRFQGHV